MRTIFLITWKSKTSNHLTHNKNLKKKYVRQSMQVTDILQPILFPSDLIHQHPCMVNFHSWLRFTECELYNIYTCTFNYHHVHWFTCLGHLPKCCHLPYVTNISLCKLYYMYVQTVLMYWHLNRNKVKETILICTCIENYSTGKQ